MPHVTQPRGLPGGLAEQPCIGVGGRGVPRMLPPPPLLTSGRESNRRRVGEGLFPHPASLTVSQNPCSDSAAFVRDGDSHSWRRVVGLESKARGSESRFA